MSNKWGKKCNSTLTLKYKPGSDVGCALCGKDLTQQVVGKVHNQLEEETLIPYFFGCIPLKDIQNKGLREHIDKQGKILYERKTPYAETTTRNKKNTLPAG